MRIKLRLKKRRNINRGGYSKTYTKKGIKFGPVSLGFMTVLLFSLVSLFYLAQSNQITTKGYVLRELDIDKARAMSENEKLQVEAARLESLNKINEKAEQLSMVPIEDLKYFGSTGGVLVKK